MSFAEYAEYDGLGLARLVATGQISASELVEAAIERIDRHNPALNAVVYKAYDEARAKAAGPVPDGPFRGVPFLIKDLGAPVAGWPCTDGTRFADERPSVQDSELVARYRAAGLILLGATNLPEFGIPGITHSARLGACRTPWNLERVSGGSSGGAAAAVASGMVPMAHASDGAGSIRIPAACCGLVGLKPTRERNPLDVDGIWALGGQLAEHIVCRTVRDSAAMLDATSQPPRNWAFAPPPPAAGYAREVGRAPGRLRVAWSPETPFGTRVDPEVAATLQRTAELLASLGHEVRAEGLGVDYLSVYRAHLDTSLVGFAAMMAGRVARLGREPADREIEPLARRAYRRGSRMTGAQAVDALRRSRLWAWQILQRFEQFDVYLTPTLGTLPPLVDDFDPLGPDLKDFDRRTLETFCFTLPFNVTGQPSMSLPLGQSATGLPIGMQLTARYADEATLFRLASQLEAAEPWAQRRPRIWG
jgi:amidase